MTATHRFRITAEGSVKKFSGFSLLELIVVLVILGLASALVAPSIQSSLGEAKIRTGARKMAALMRYARNQALTSKQIVAVTSDAAGGRWRLEYTELQAPERSVSLPQGIKGKIIERYFTFEPVSRRKVLFFPKGNTSGQAVELYDDRGRRLLLSIDPVTGNISLSRSS